MVSRFGCQTVEPFKEPVLIINSKDFKSEWEKLLRSEGCKILVSDYLGKAAFFIRKTGNGEVQNSQAQADPQAPPASQQQPKPELKPLVWNEETFKLIEDMRKQGFSYMRITEKLREMGFKTSATTVLRKMRERENKATPKPQEALNCEGSDSLFREILEGASLLYERRLKRACALLLRQASSMIEQL
ncbi:MAG: hypothetical protein QXG76_03175 [Candidatus Bathyarchaeia archaeon]